jgi:hypothetical protein
MANEPATNGDQAPPPSHEQIKLLREEQGRLQYLVKALEDERDQLRQALAVVQKERDEYLHALYGYLRKEYPLEKALEDFQNLREENGVPASEVLAECEQMVAKYERSRGA